MDSDIVVVDEIEKSVDFPGTDSQDQINPGETELPVVEETVKAAAPEMDDAEDTPEVEADPAADAEEDAAEGEMDDETKKAIDTEDVPAEDAAVKMVTEIGESLSSALSTLAETVKALDAKIEGITKSVAGISTEFEEVKDKFGKRVDAVEKDTAFRKSADLGEILQEQPMVTQKSLWGGSFLKNADLFR